MVYITNGDAFNEHFQKKNGVVAIPFREAMMDGDVPDVPIFSDAFIRARASHHGVTQEYYRMHMQDMLSLKETLKEEPALSLHFGCDTFCQMNLLTLLAYLEELGYTGKVSLTLIDDETFSTIEEGIPVPLGIYRAIFHTLLVVRRTTPILGVIRGDAIRHFWDYHNDDGFLAHTVREHSDEDEEDLLFRLINISAEYGLSEEMARRLIKKYKE